MTEEKVSVICKALSDPNRLKIVCLLTKGELCACKILETFEIDHSTLSHHMKVLAECSLVNVRKESKWSFYSINCETLSSYREFIGSLICDKSAKSKGCCK